MGQSVSVGRSGTRRPLGGRRLSRALVGRRRAGRPLAQGHALPGAARRERRRGGRRTRRPAGPRVGRTDRLGPRRATALGGAPRTVQLPRSPEARFLLRTSGTAGERKWIALSDANLFAVLRSHLPVLGLNVRHRMLSTLPWSHAFGLVLEFLAAVCVGASLVRCSEPRDPDEHVRLLRECKLDWWNAVPAMVRRFAEKNYESLAMLRGVSSEAPPSTAGRAPSWSAPRSALGTARRKPLLG
jgi:acyl-CoA synthetase (AMP-forming)/AMP-acid ligase II